MQKWKFMHAQKFAFVDFMFGVTIIYDYFSIKATLTSLPRGTFFFLFSYFFVFSTFFYKKKRPEKSQHTRFKYLFWCFYAANDKCLFTFLLFSEFFLHKNSEVSQKHEANSQKTYQLVIRSPLCTRFSFSIIRVFSGACHMTLVMTPKTKKKLQTQP